jgi:hypothetical protein
MSVSDRALSDHAARTVERLDHLPTVGATVARLLTRSVRAVAFWVAALLPLSYLPLLATGVLSERPLGFAALLCVNATAFMLGHAYGRSETHTVC